MTNSSENLFKGILAAKNGSVPEGTPAENQDTTAEDDNAQSESAEAAPQVTELDMLKKRAALLGIKHSNNISAEKLREKINAKLAAEDTENESEDEDEEQELPAGLEALVSADDDDDDEKEAVTAAPVQTKIATKVAEKLSLRQKLHNDKMKLVRLRITNLNPAKKDLPGEIFTVANEILGTVRKFIPYGEATDNGYHVPFWIYEQLKDREFQNIRVTKDSQGRRQIHTSMAREFALEVLPPLTEVELAQLAAQQAAAAGLD